MSLVCFFLWPYQPGDVTQVSTTLQSIAWVIWVARALDTRWCGHSLLYYLWLLVEKLWLLDWYAVSDWEQGGFELGLRVRASHSLFRTAAVLLLSTLFLVVRKTRGNDIKCCWCLHCLCFKIHILVDFYVFWVFSLALSPAISCIADVSMYGS